MIKKLCLTLLLFLFGMIIVGCAKTDVPVATTGLTVMTAPPATTAPPAITALPAATGYVGTIYDRPASQRIVPDAVTLDPAVYYITTPWHYPDTGNMTQAEKEQMVKDRSEQMAHMTTETLLDSVLQHPGLVNYLATSQTSVLGYMAASGIPFLKDLFEREDLEWVMYHYPAEKLDSAAKDMTFRYIKAYLMGATYLMDPNAFPVAVEFRW